MRGISIFVALFLPVLFVTANPIKERVKTLFSLMDSYPDSTIRLALEIREDPELGKDGYGLVQSNFILAYIYDDVKGDYGKAVIYYLEAIRHARKAEYEKATKNLISLHKNIGLIFSKFKAYDLAEDYYTKGLEYAGQIDDTKQVVSLNFNLALMYKDMKEFARASSVLEHSLLKVDIGKKYFEILNMLSLVHLLDGNLEMAEEYAKSVLNHSSSAPTKILAYANQNIGIVYDRKERYLQAEIHFKKSIELINKVENLSDQTALFRIYQDMGLCYHNGRNYEKSEETFREAESLISELTQIPKFFELYKKQADLYFDLGEYDKSKRYEDLYAISSRNYLEKQEDLQDKDQRYNMDLITKRYFDEVDKEERIADIMFYSKLSSGGLFILLILVIGYYQYQRVTTRKTLERELIELKLVK